MEKNYLFEEKENIVNFINKIKNKDKLINVYKIISKEKNLNFSYNENGIFILFNDMSNEICYNLDNYISSIKKQKLLNSNNFSSSL